MKASKTFTIGVLVFATGAPFVYAQTPDTSVEFRFYAQETNDGTQAWGNSTTDANMGWAINYWRPGFDMYISKVSVYMDKYGYAASDCVYVQIFQSGVGNLATSTECVAASVMSGAAWQEFTFDTPVYLASTTVYAVGQNRTGIDTAKYYLYYGKNYVGSPMKVNRPYTLSTSAWGRSPMLRIDGYLPEGVFICEGGGDTMCNMASTTEAIYITSQVNQVYWGILFLVLFGALGFIFTRKYV